MQKRTSNKINRNVSSGQEVSPSLEKLFLATCTNRDAESQGKEGPIIPVDINHLSIFSLVTAKICKPVKAECIWNNHTKTYTTELINNTACMKFYDATKPLYLQMKASGICLGTQLLKVRNSMNCVHDETPHNTILRYP